MVREPASNSKGRGPSLSLAPGTWRLAPALFQFPKPRVERPREKRLTEHCPLAETRRKRECGARFCCRHTSDERLPCRLLDFAEHRNVAIVIGCAADGAVTG